MIIVPIQIRRLINRPKLWRLTCFSSSAVGLLCYALSSSFSHLFGKWTWWKLSLYTVFSFIICLAVLFAKAWRPSPTLWLKSHLAFLVLILTSIYSFFLDKAVKGEPDAYSLVSCIAFAIMSLGLSRQTHCGFEIDLLYFFCGCLIIQLMKIKLWLGTVGASFGYFLVILRSILDSPPANGSLVGSSLDSIHVQEDHIVIQVRSDSQDTNTGSTIQLDSSQSNTDPASNALLTMPRETNNDSALEAPIKNEDLGFQDHTVTHSDSGHIKLQLMTCIKALEKENKNLISRLSKHVDEYLQEESQNLDSRVSIHGSALLGPDINLVMDSLPSRVINNLRETVKLMVEAGFEEELCCAYSSSRREFLNGCLSISGLQDLEMEDVDNMSGKIPTWIEVSKVALRILFPNERRLCDHIFQGFSSAANISFMQVCRDLTICILKFANTVATGNHSTEVSLRITSTVLKTLDDLLPEFEVLFSDHYSLSLRKEAFMFSEKLSNAKRGIFMLLENLICQDMRKEVVPEGGVHPITCKVINCLKVVCDPKYISSNRVFAGYSMVLDTQRKSPSLDKQFAQIIELLENNLEVMSKTYRNRALGYVFIMNNLMYMNLSYPMPILSREDWIKKCEEKIQRSLKLYQISSWGKVLDLLKLDNHGSEEPNVVAELMKDKLNLFYMHFDEICRVQSEWHCVDKGLGRQILKSIEDILLPIYGQFIGRFQDVLGKHAYEYIKYGIFDIQDCLKHLFVVGKRVNLMLKEK